MRIFTHLNVTRPKKKRKRNDSLLSTSESAACSFLLLLLLLLLFACVYFCFHFSPTCPCSLTAQFAIDRSGGGSNGGWGGGGGVRLPCQPKKERERERELSEDLLARKFRVRLFSSIPGKRAVLGETKATSCFIDRLLPIYDTTARRLWSINPVSPPHLRPRLLFPNRKKSFKSDLIFRKFPLGPPHVSQKEIKDIFFCFPLRSSFGEKRRIRWRGFDGSFSGTVISLLNFALDFLDSALYSRWCMQNNWPFRQLRVPFSAADSNAICWRFYLQHFSFQSTLAGLIIETHTPRSIISGVIIQIFRRRKPGVFTFFSQGLLPFFPVRCPFFFILVETGLKSLSNKRRRPGERIDRRRRRSFRRRNPCRYRRFIAAGRVIELHHTPSHLALRPPFGFIGGWNLNKKRRHQLWVAISRSDAVRAPVWVCMCVCVWVS